MATKTFLMLTLVIVVIASGGVVVISKVRSIRNNNPGNIRTGDKWQGMAPEQTDLDFVKFQSAEWGYRAMVKILRNYQKRGINTVREIISTWAPTTENNTQAYINAVCKQTGLHPDKSIDINDHLQPILKAITRHEGGIAAAQYFKDADIEKGIELA